MLCSRWHSSSLFVKSIVIVSARKIKLKNTNLITSLRQRDFHNSSSTNAANRFGSNSSGSIFADKFKKMSVPSTVEDLTQICIELRRVVNSAKDEAEKEKIVLKHVKTYAETGLKVNDFAKGTRDL